MPPPKLTVKLSGDESLGGNVLFADFREFCEALTVCLHTVETLVAGRTRLRYLMSDVASGSVAVTLEPMRPRKGHDVSGEVVELFVKTVRQLEEGEEIDRRFPKETLYAFRRLGGPLHRRGAGVEIGGRRITAAYIAHIDTLIGASIPSEGSVSGRLERINLHERNEFALYPPIEGFVVVCVFPDEMTDTVIAAINRTVTVSGRMTFKPDKPFPERVQVRAIEIHPPDNELPKLGELRGLLRGAIGNRSAVEFIKAIRNE
jgi:hypothetical protein